MFSEKSACPCSEESGNDFLRRNPLYRKTRLILVKVKQTVPRKAFFPVLGLEAQGQKAHICSVRLMARSSPSQGEDIGSNPLPNNLDTHSNTFMNFHLDEKKRIQFIKLIPRN